MKRRIPVNDVMAVAQASKDGPCFCDALSAPGLSLICELKKASPSKGVLSSEYPYMEISRDYERDGAAAISVLTEPTHFQGRNRHLQEVSSQTEIPVLRKDFIIDEYQIYESKALGASAVLLICSILDQDTLVEFLDTARELGMSALVEAHDEDEVMRAVDSKAEVIGVNNRDLRDFKVDLNVSVRSRQLIPRDRLFVSESGVKTAEDARFLQEIGADAILVGESLMTATDRAGMMRGLRGGT